MNRLLPAIALVLLFASCKTLNSFTTIRPEDRFILGRNEHGPFSVHLTNLSGGTLRVALQPPSGEAYPARMVPPNEGLKLRVPRNTALFLINPTKDTASVRLVVRGDLNLGMQSGQ